MKETVKKEKVEWDRKRIILFLIAAVALIGIGFELKSVIMGDNAAPPPAVKGASIQPPPDIKQGIQDQINKLKSEAQNINLAEVASSSPQVQKVINDLKAVQGYPGSQLKTTCENICNGL